MSEQGEGHSDKGGAGEGAKAETYKVVVSGQEVEVPLAELLNGYQRQADYTKKTQEISAREKQFDRQVEDEAMKLYLEALKKGDGNSDKAKDESTEGEKTARELAALKARVDSQDKARQSAEADQVLDMHLKEVLGKFPKADSEKLLISFYKEAQDDTDVSKFFGEKAEAMHKAAEAYDQKIIDEYVTRRQKDALGGSHDAGGSTSKTGQAPKPVATFEEARERAAQRIAAATGHQ